MTDRASPAPAARLTPAESRVATKSALRVAGWGLLVYAGAHLAGALLEAQSMASAVAQAVVAEWGVGRIGVAWSDPRAAVPTAAQIAKRAALGAAVGLVLAAGLVAFLVATRAVLLEPSAGAAPLSGAAVAVALITSGFYAMRDELLLHGVVLRALVTVPRPALRVLACAVTSAGAAAGEPGATPASVAFRFGLGAVFGALWVRDRGAWQAWGAHTAFLFASGAVLGGGLLGSAKVAASSWGGGGAGALAGSAALIGVFPFALAALAWAFAAERKRA